MDRLPKFIVVGPPRTATTWLDKALRGHVGLPVYTKETHFFSRNYEKGLRWYADHFRDCPEDQVVGEICASYFENPDSPLRIFQHIPDCRIVCTLRDPVDRLYSYYKLMRHNGKTALPFEQAVMAHPKMLEFSRYATLVRRWQAQFGEDQVLVLLNDDMTAAPQQYVDRIAAFIGSPPIALGEEILSRNRQNTIETAPRSLFLARNGRRLRNWLGANQLYGLRRGMDRAGVWRLCFEGGEPYPRVNAATRSRLQNLLGPEIDQLEALLGRDLSAWRQ